MNKESALAKLKEYGYTKIDKSDDCLNYGQCNDKSCASTIRLCDWGLSYNSNSALYLLRCELDLKRYQTQNDKENDTRVYETNGVRYTFMPGYINGEKAYSTSIKRI